MTRTGRPRDPLIAAAVEEAALELVATTGFDAVSIEQIAAAAGIGKPSIYRRWPGKTELVIDAVRHRLESAPDPADTGSLRDDLVAMFGFNADELTRDDRLALGVAAALTGHPEIAAAVRAHTEAFITRQAAVVLGRAIARGELPSGSAGYLFPFHAAEALILGRTTGTATPMETAFLLQAVDDLLLPALLRGPADGHDSR